MSDRVIAFPQALPEDVRERLFLGTELVEELHRWLLTVRDIQEDGKDTDIRNITDILSGAIGSAALARDTLRDGLAHFCG